MPGKVHILYKYLSRPSVVTLCGMLDSDSLLVARDEKLATCVQCLKLFTKHDTRHNIVRLPESCPLCAAQLKKEA